jgi:hypothetical protein
VRERSERFMGDGAGAKRPLLRRKQYIKNELHEAHLFMLSARFSTTATQYLHGANRFSDSLYPFFIFI